MPAGRSFDAELAAIDGLRDADSASTHGPIRNALTHRNNFIVAKAAKLAALHEHTTLTDDLATAFPRFLKGDCAKADPQCWAKNALAQTLAAFDYQDEELFLAGMRHIQLEPVWGGSSDTAGTLRGTCALALVNCRSMSSRDVLAHLTPLFADKQLPVQVNAARAVEQIGSDAASLLLRLRAELGSGEPELLGACYSGVLRLDGASAIPWAARFLHTLAPDEASAEAAFAISATRTEAAWLLLKEHYARARDPDFRGTLLTAIALTRQDAALDFLFALIEEGSRTAREALESTAPSPATLERLRLLA